MFNRTDETKVLRDPIHGYIHVQYQVIWDCLNAREFQRLHRIHQLGGVFQVYHTAEHSRFAHSLGVYEICRRMVYENDDINQALTESEKIQVMCAGLLHDLGHGPYSHFFESIQDISHEKRTVQLILDKNTEIHQALIKENKELPQQIASIIEHRHPKTMLNQMISSQLDADRMDYLLRDAYETGTSYGTFDLERILRTMRVKDSLLCMKESGMHSVEDYIMARYHMYWQVYLHPDAKSYELLINSFFKRYAEVKDRYPIPVFESFSSHLTNEQFLELDDYRMMVGFQDAMKSDDEILQLFAKAIVDRHLFEWMINPDDQQIYAIKKYLKEHNRPEAYFYYEDISSNQTYFPYDEKNAIIWIRDSHQNLKPLSDCSEIVKALLRMESHTEQRIYYWKRKKD